MISINVKVDLWPDLSKRAQNRAFKAAYSKVGLVWHQKLLPRHFTRDAKRQYSHSRRSERYLKRKARRQRTTPGGTTDLVLTGRLRSAMKTASVQAFPTRAKLRVQAPGYVTVRPNPRGKRPDAPFLFGELSRMTADDQRILDKVYIDELDRAIQHEVNNPRARRPRG